MKGGRRSRERKEEFSLQVLSHVVALFAMFLHWVLFCVSDINCSSLFLPSHGPQQSDFTCTSTPFLMRSLRTKSLFYH